MRKDRFALGKEGTDYGRIDKAAKYWKSGRGAAKSSRNRDRRGSEGDWSKAGMVEDSGNR